MFLKALRQVQTPFSVVVVVVVERVVIPISVGEDVEGGGERVGQRLPGRGHPLAKHGVIHAVPEVNKSKKSNLF